MRERIGSSAYRVEPRESRHLDPQCINDFPGQTNCAINGYISVWKKPFLRNDVRGRGFRIIGVRINEIRVFMNNFKSVIETGKCIPEGRS